MEELASRVQLSVAALFGAADFLEENHFKFDILEEAGVAEMIMFAVGVGGAFATIELFQANLAFEVPKIRPLLDNTSEVASISPGAF